MSEETNPADLAQRVADLEAERDEAQQAIAEARADGAREMRDVAAAAGYASAAERDGHRVFDAILALPLPAKREPVRLTDGEAMDALPDCHGASLGKTWLLSAARAIETAVLAANGMTK